MSITISNREFLNVLGLALELAPRP